MINDGGHACLADFSLLTLAPDESTTMITCVEGGTIPWMSPELLNPIRFGLTESRPTKESDCYALGMVIYEVLSGQVPFALVQRQAPAAMKVIDGERPERPRGEEGKLITDAIWEVLEHCWKDQPSDRPTVEAVLQSLGGVPSRTPQHNGLQNPLPSTFFLSHFEHRARV